MGAIVDDSTYLILFLRTLFISMQERDQRYFEANVGTSKRPQNGSDKSFAKCAQRCR